MKKNSARFSFLTLLLLFFNYSHAQSVSELYKRGQEKYNKHDTTGAIADYTKAIEKDPSYANPFISRAGIYDDMGEYEKAVADYSSALTTNPDKEILYWYRALSYRHMHEYEKAIADYDKAISLDPKDEDAFMSRGITHVAQKNIPKPSKITIAPLH